MPVVKGFSYQDFVQAAYVQGAAAGTAPSSFVFVNPSGSGEYYQIVEVTGVWDVVGGAAAAADVQVVPAATAMAGGTTALASTFDLTTGARTSVKKALTATAGNRVVAPGSSVSVVTSGTLTGLAGLCVQIVLRPLRGSKRRF